MKGSPAMCAGGGERVFVERDGRGYRHELELHRGEVRCQRARPVVANNNPTSLLWAGIKAGHEKRSKQQADAQPEQQ
jgi:hypothetical protein